MSATRPPAIFVYSKSGHSAHAARALARISDAEVIPVVADRYRGRGFWMLRGILDIARKDTPTLEPSAEDIVGRPWVVVAGPVWAGRMAPPVTGLLKMLSDAKTPVGLLSTAGGKPTPEKAYASAHEALGRALRATVNIPNGIEDTPEMTERLEYFALVMAESDAGVVA